MGNECFAHTPNQHYSQYLNKTNVNDLKDLWQTVKLYKVKKIFDTHAVPHESLQKVSHIPFEVFQKMFPSFQNYQHMHKRRLFQIFDNQNLGYLNWDNFYSSISICYFAPQQILSIIIFMLFDQTLLKQLSKQQITSLVSLNSFAFKKKSGPQTLEQPDQEDVLFQLLGDANSIKIKEWTEKAEKLFEFSKFRRLFNIFPEERLQKQLIKNFNQWNQLYVEETQKYVSYVISYKWFETWKIYVEQHYNVIINTNQLKNPTTRTMRTTKKILANKKIITTNKIICSLKTYRMIEVQKNKKSQEQSDNQDNPTPKNIDFIHNNIGSRPRDIFNNVLEGQFQQVLKPQLVQNRDYVLISQKVWNSLKQIYGGGPQFRRTGFDSIQLYPKIIKIYSSLFRNQIDYSSQVIRQVSGYLTIQQLFLRSVDISQQQLKKKKVYYKTIGMVRWEEVTELNFMFSELTSDIMIFLMYLDQSDDETFKKIHSKASKQITEINSGDYVKYIDPKTKMEKTAVFMGKNIEGKYILHFPKQSYIYDECLIQADAIKNCKIYTATNPITDLKMKNKQQIQIKGISNNKGLGLINSTILNLFNNRKFRKIFSLMKSNTQDNKMIHFLTDILNLLNQKKKVNIRDIKDMIQLYLPQHQNFQISMTYNFISDFYQHLINEMKDMQLINSNQGHLLEIQSYKKCLKCQTQLKDNIEMYCMSLPLPQENNLIYQISFIPICTTLKSTEIKKYGISLPKGSTLKKLKDTFEKVAELDKKRVYVLVQIYSNRIIKNYNEVDQNTPLQRLKLRDGDTIYAFQLYIDFQRFVANHYTTNNYLTSKQVKVDNFIDCKHNDRGWIYGKICQIQHLPYTQQTLIKVLHKFSKNQQWQVIYDFKDESIAKFPTKCHMNAQQFHLQLTQRYFNQATNQMQICNIPLVVVLTSWMRWKQFKYLIYLQIKRFISSQYALQDINQADYQQMQMMKIISTKQIKSSKNININNSKKTQKFKQYLSNPNFPYRLILSDSQGRCAVCFKFIKTNIYKGQSQIYCSGCQLSQSQPICWQIKVADVIVCVDWKNLNCIQKDIIKPHSSIVNLHANKKKVVQSLQNCFKSRFQPFIQQQQLLCCNRLLEVENIQKITKLPQILPIYLQRIILQQDGYKRINKSHLQFPLKDFLINKTNYNLIGVTSIQGNNKNIKYKTYVKYNQGKDDQWVEYDGEYARVVKGKDVQKVCALVVYYKKNQTGKD